MKYRFWVEKLKKTPSLVDVFAGTSPATAFSTFPRSQRFQHANRKGHLRKMVTRGVREKLAFWSLLSLRYTRQLFRLAFWPKVAKRRLWKAARPARRAGSWAAQMLSLERCKRARSSWISRRPEQCRGLGFLVQGCSARERRDAQKCCVCLPREPRRLAPVGSMNLQIISSFSSKMFLSCVTICHHLFWIFIWFS